MTLEEGSGMSEWELSNCWKKSSLSGQGDCVEWRIEENGVRLRDSKAPNVAELFFSYSEWMAFTRSVKAGEADLPREASDARLGL